MNLKNNKVVQKVITISSITIVIGILGWISFVTVRNEVKKYTESWQEIQFAKNHPMLVGAIREKYELGLKALDQMAREEVEVLSPLPQTDRSK